METFYSTSRYLNNLLDTDSPCFFIYDMANQSYPHDLQLNSAYALDKTVPFKDLHIFVPSGLVSFKIYDKGDDFSILTCNFRW